MDRRGAEKSREMMLDELLGYDRITTSAMTIRMRMR